MSRQSGVALITVLLTIALASIATTSMLNNTWRSVRRTTLLDHGAIAHHYALGAEQWALAILSRDGGPLQVDHLGEPWASALPPLPIEGGVLQGSIIDAQATYNVNSLLRLDGQVDPVHLAFLRHLLQQQGLDPGIAQAIADWIDADSEPLFPDGAEDSAYAGAEPPYRTANRPLASLTELRLIRGIDATAYSRLSGLLTALPLATSINLNTAPPAMLRVLGVEGSDDHLQALLTERNRQGWKTVQEALQALQLAEPRLPRDNLGVASRFFVLSAEVRVGDGRAALTSLIDRSPGGSLHVLARRYGHPQ